MNRAVVYYSLSGNTKEAAKVIARKLGAKIFEIDLVKPLPKNTVRHLSLSPPPLNVNTASILSATP